MSKNNKEVIVILLLNQELYCDQFAVWLVLKNIIRIDLYHSNFFRPAIYMPFIYNKNFIKFEKVL